MELSASSGSSLSENRWLKATVSLRWRRVLVIGLFVVLAAGFYIDAYVSHPNHYPVGNKLSWWNWWDQGQYITSAKALRSHDLSPPAHHYPIGYAALGALFYDVMPNDPFFIPDLLCFTVICVAFILICRPFIGLTEALLVCFFGIVWQSTVRVQLAVPWSTIPRHAALYTLAWLGIYHATDPLYPLLSGLCFGGIYAARPGDIILALPMLVVPLLLSIRQHWVLIFSGRFVLAASSIILCVHAFNYIVYGALFPTAYFEAVRAVGFNLSFVPAKALSLFIDPQLLYGEPTSLIAVFPYLLLILPGAVVFVKRLGGAGMGIVGAQAVTLLYYLAFNDFSPENVWRFEAIHYILWLLPLFVLFAYLTVRLAWVELGFIATFGLLALSMLFVSVPNIVLTPVKGLYRSTQGVAKANQTEAVFQGPKQLVDAIVLEGVQTRDVQVWLNDRHVQWRKDVAMVLPDGSPGLTLLLYSSQYITSVRVTSSVQNSAALASAHATYYSRAWAATFRGPRTFLVDLPAALRFTNLSKSDAGDLSGPPIGPCGRSPLRIDNVEATKGIVRRAPFPNVGSDDFPNLRLNMEASLPDDTLVYRIHVAYSAGGQWMSTSRPDEYPILPNLWGAALLGAGESRPLALYHFAGQCGAEHFSVALPLPSATVSGTFELRLDTSRGTLSATSKEVRLQAK